MKVLITGSNGLVGHALQSIVKSQEDNHEYIFLTRKDGDLTKENDIAHIFETHKPTAVIHLAANVGGLFKNMYKKSEMLEDNALMNILLLKYARIYNIEKIIVILSTCIFPDGVTPLTEDKLHIGPPHPSNEGYACAKRLMEVHARILSTQHNIKTVCLTPTNLYGEFDNFDIQNAHVIPALIHKCYEAKTNKEPFIVCGTGKPLRQFLYSQDFARMIYKTLQDDTLNNHHFICSTPSSQEVTIEYVARKIANLMDYEYGLGFDAAYADGQYKKTVEPNIYFKDFSYTSFDVGIEKAVQWFLETKSYKK